jgi:hypothetical protein
VRIDIGQEKDEARMKLLNRNTRQNRELYQQTRKEANILYRGKKRKKINKRIVDIQRTIIKNTEFFLKMLKK